MATPVLGYWKIRALAYPIRLLLEYTGAPYEEKLYTFGPAPNFDRSSWLDVKYTLGLDFPNLPYYIDGPTKITQSNAILRHIARKYDLCGKTEEEMIRIDIIENQAMDFRRGFVVLALNPEFETLKAAYVENLEEPIKQFSQFLGDRKWFAGDHLTYVDFVMYDLLDLHVALAPNCLEHFKNLEDFVKRVEALESIAKYRSSPRCIKFPMTADMAYFGGRR